MSDQVISMVMKSNIPWLYSTTWLQLLPLIFPEPHTTYTHPAILNNTYAESAFEMSQATNITPLSHNKIYMHHLWFFRLLVNQISLLILVMKIPKSTLYLPTASRQLCVWVWIMVPGCQRIACRRKTLSASWHGASSSILWAPTGAHLRGKTGKVSRLNAFVHQLSLAAS